MKFLVIYLKIFFLFLFSAALLVAMFYLLAFGFGQTITFFDMQSANVKLILGAASLIVAVPFSLVTLAVIFGWIED